MGFPRERWYEDGFWESQVHPEDLEQALEFYKEMGVSSTGGDFEYRMLNSKDEIVWFRDVVSVTQPEDATPILRGFMIDITIRKEAESKLRESEAALLVSRQRLQDLAGKLLTAQEEERRRLAREIHDDLSQRLAGLASKTGYLEQAAAREESLRTDQLKEVHTELVDLARDVRTLSRGLHPSMLEHLGLEDALRWECESFSKRTGVEVVFVSDEVPSDVRPQVGICLFRITQSALHNVQRHAETKRAKVSLQGGESDLRLAIEDEGAGFENTGAEIGNGMGLASMEERVRLVQGELQIETAPGKGTRVVVEVPMTQG
jgi:signal transduction histidine kinase